MMWVAVIVAALGCYALKLAGLSLPESFLQRADVRRVAMFLPVAMLAALIATEMFDAGGGRLAVDPRLLAGVGASVVALLFRASFIVVIVVAAVTTAVLRLLT